MHTPAPDSPPPAAPDYPLAVTPWNWRLSLAAAAAALGSAAWLLRDTLGPRGVSGLGFVCFLFVAATCSANLARVNWRTVASGFVLQLLLALFVLKLAIPDGSGGWYYPGREMFHAVGDVAKQFLSYSDAGAKFVFGRLADPPEMGKVFGPGGAVVFAFKVLPTVVFVSAFFTVLYHLGVLQAVVRVFARVMSYVMGTSGAETLSVSANVFMGQTEAPLVVKPFVPRMTASEVFALMVSGMAHVSGALMAVYIGMGADAVAVLATSVMAAPASLYLAKLVVPELGRPETLGDVRTADERPHANAVDAAAAGASDGLMLALNIAAMLVAFIAGVAMINSLLGQLDTGRAFSSRLARADSAGDAARLVLPLLAWFAVGWLALGGWRRWLGRTIARLGRRPDAPAWQGELGAGVVAFAAYYVAVDIFFWATPPGASLQSLLSVVFAPAAFLMGVDFRDVPRVAELLGTKLVLNEFVAYDALTSAGKPGMENGLSERSYRLAAYALTGFANFASVGIQLGGLGTLAPNKRRDLARLGMLALGIGFLVSLLNAALAGVLLD